MTNCTMGRVGCADQFYQAQAGDRASLNELMQQHKGLVHHVIRQQSSGPLSYAELLQAGQIGLWRAILGFDPQRGVAFSTYACVSVRHHIWQAVKRAKAQAVRQGDGLEPRGGLELVEQVLEQDVVTVLLAMVKGLPAQRRQVVCAYYGLCGERAHTQAELAAEKGCTHQAISYQLRRALEQLRHPSSSASLRALLGRNRRQDYLQAIGGGRRRG
jgi:RNA polymerase sigma factor (sigma-70 family)